MTGTSTSTVQVLTEELRGVLGRALADAIAYRQPKEIARTARTSTAACASTMRRTWPRQTATTRLPVRLAWIWIRPGPVETWRPGSERRRPRPRRCRDGPAHRRRAGGSRHGP